MTAELHAALEARLDLLSPALSQERYRLVLVGFHGYFSAVEPQLVALANHAHVSLPIVARAGILERDLISLGLAPDAIALAPRCKDLPTLREREHLAGCLYVLEGSRLGGKIIARFVEQHLGLSSEHGCAFFAGVDEQPKARWTEVLSWLECLATEAEVDPQKIVSSAAETFRSLEGWLATVGALQ